VNVQEAHGYMRAIQQCSTDLYRTAVTSSYCVSYRRLAIKRNIRRKLRFFIAHLHSTPPISDAVGILIFWREKLKWWGCQAVKKVREKRCDFSRDLKVPWLAHDRTSWGRLFQRVGEETEKASEAKSPTFTYRPHSGWSRRNFAKMFNIGKATVA